MRILTLILITFVACAVTSAAQKQSRPHHKPKPRAVKREPFDPARDPKADLAAAMTKAAAQHKRIILDVGGEWCGWCRYMDDFLTAHPVLSKTRDRSYVWLKINYSEENENKAFLAAYPDIEGYPHLFVLDTDGKLLQSQDTSAFERGEVYSAGAILKFLKDWAPAHDAH